MPPAQSDIGTHRETPDIPQDHPSQNPPELILLLRRIGRTWVTYVKGQLLVALIVGLIASAAGSLIGLAGASVLGFAAGILTTVPSLGALVATVLAAIVALWQGSSILPVENWVFALIVAGVYLAIQQVGVLVIEPRIVGKRLHLPALVVLMAVIVGAAIGNVIGAYLAVPILVTAREIVRFTHRKLRGLPPFPEGGEPPAP